MLKFDTPTLVTLTAPTCSGKSYLLNALAARGCGRIVSTTTRPKREDETQGIDYDYITIPQSERMEDNDEFFELISFRSNRYGVTNKEMSSKMADWYAPIVVLAPKGLAIYEQKCREHGWNIFKVYVHTIESKRIERLNIRAVGELTTLLGQERVDALTASSTHTELANGRLSNIIATHTDRLLSITAEERLWRNTNIWDVSVPGDDLEKAFAMLAQGVEWRNYRLHEPTPYTHVYHHSV